MIVDLLLTNGETITIQTNDSNVNALLGRLNGAQKWIDANGDEKTLINIESVVRIKIKPEPE